MSGILIRELILLLNRSQIRIHIKIGEIFVQNTDYSVLLYVQEGKNEAQQSAFQKFPPVDSCEAVVFLV